ncbi:MAG: hypothetical protein KC431_19770, partial [Myxococcales bacterium]|nr:hypothetical protein [Myxococcales bacterium]
MTREPRLLGRSLPLSVFVLTLLGCTEPTSSWVGEPFAVTDADLYTVVNGLAGGSEGVVLITRESGPVLLDTGLAPWTIRDIAACSATDCPDIAVGDAGAVAMGTNAAPWTTFDLGVSADLRAVTRTGDYVAVVGDETLVVWYEPEGPSSQFSPAPPEGSWGSLRDIFAGAAVGDGGMVVVSDDMHEWRREDPGVSVDLLALSFFDPDPLDAEPGRLWAVGREGTVLLRGGDGTWERLDTGLESDLLAVSAGFVLTDDRRLLRIDPQGGVERPIGVPTEELATQ